MNMKLQGDSLESRIDRIQWGIRELFENISTVEGEIVSIGVIATFDDVVIVKDYNSQKLYSLEYSELDGEIKFGSPKEVDNVYVVKQLINANPDVTLKDMQDLLDSWDDWSDSLEKYMAVIKGKSGINNPKALWTQLYFQKKEEWPVEKIEMKSKSLIELTGPIVFKNVKKRIAFAAVLVPGEEDSDGEIVSKEKIEDVAHEWMEDYQHIDLKHSLNAVGKPVESYLTYSERTVKSIDGEEITLPVGTWILGSKLDEETFEAVEKGELTGYSIMGVARKALKEKDLKKALKSLQDDTDILKVLKKTLLKDLGPDWVPVAVAVVGSPAVPKSKWFALKSKAVKPKENLWDKIIKTLKGGKKENKIKIIVKEKKPKEWTKADAKSWLKEHDFKHGDYEKIANYHAFRQEDPGKYDEFRADKKPFDFEKDDGVIVVYGIYKKDGKRTSEIQSIKFFHGEEAEKSKSKIKLIKKGGKTVNEERKKKIKEVLKSIKDEKGEVEEEKLEVAIEKIVEEEIEGVAPVKEPIDEKIAEKIEETVKEVIETKLKEAMENVQKEIETLKTQLTEFGKGMATEKEVIKEMAKVLKIDPSKALKGQDGGDDDDKAKKGKALDFGDRDGFGRKKSKKE